MSPKRPIDRYLDRYRPPPPISLDGTEVLTPVACSARPRDGALSVLHRLGVDVWLDDRDRTPVE